MEASMSVELGKKYLITCDNWFLAPDGKQYRAVHGTVNRVMNDTDTLGIQTNRHSTNWFLQVGNVMVAGCQIHYAVRSDNCNFGDVKQENVFDGEFKLSDKPSSIYNADS